MYKVVCKEYKGENFGTFRSYREAEQSIMASVPSSCGTISRNGNCYTISAFDECETYMIKRC